MATPAKKVKLDSGENTLLKSFCDWLHDENFNVNKKIRVSKEGSCAQYGLIADDDLSAGEILFQVPRTVLLTPQTCKISELLAKEKDSLISTSGWVELLVALMYEYTNPESRWRLYLDIVSGPEVDLPMFWDKTDVEEELKHTGIPEAVTRDLNKITKEYNCIVLPFLKRHETIFNLEKCTLDLYKHLTAFVMSYSFTEPADDDGSGEDDEEDDLPRLIPMMVPLADILNHVAKNNAKLIFDREVLKMVTVCAVKKGEEIFNTYGHLANWQLLHMYGFAELYPNNHYDTVDIPIDVVLEQYKKDLTNQEMELFNKKFTFLQDTDIISPLVIGMDGILTEIEMHSIFKVLFMSEEDFREYKVNDGWLEESDEEKDALSNENLHSLPKKWLILLKNSAEACVQKYKNSLEEDEAFLESPKLSELNEKQKWSLYVRLGQRKLLRNIINLCPV